jgi:hypothetical protein
MRDTNSRERDEINVTNDDVFRSVCSAYLTPIFVVCADIADEKIQHLYSFEEEKKLLNQNNYEYFSTISR